MRDRLVSPSPLQRPISNRSYFFLVAIILFSIAIRIVFSLGISRELLHLKPELQYNDGYHAIARNLLEGHGYRLTPGGSLATERAPLYPGFLFAIFSVAGVDYVSVQIAQAFLGGLSCWILFLLGRWVYSNDLGLTAAALYSIYPNSIEYSARLYAENVYFPVFLGFAYLLCRASYQGSIRLGFASGVTWGLSLLTRGTLLPLPIVLPIGIALSHLHRKPILKWIKWTIPAAIAGVLVVAPWSIRNYRITNEFVPVSTWGWPPMYHGTQVAKRMGEWIDLVNVDIEATLYVRKLFVEQSKTLTPTESERHYAARYNDFAKELTLADWKCDPMGMLKRTLRGTVYAWFFTFGAKTRVLSLAVHLPLLILFITGAIYVLRKHNDAFTRSWPALCLILFVNAFYAAAYPHIRYMTPAVALSFIFSAFPLLYIWNRLQVRWLSRVKQPTPAF